MLPLLKNGSLIKNKQWICHRSILVIEQDIDLSEMNFTPKVY